jgi:hypothetical protein
VGDSKLLYKPGKPDGLAALERGVLAMLACLPDSPAPTDRLTTLAAGLCPGWSAERDGCPWYAGAELPLPRCAGAGDVALSANAVRRAMATAGVELVALRCEICPAGSFNRLLSATGNKSVAAFTLIGRLMAWAWSVARDGEPVYLYVDRQGGRTHYRDDVTLVLQAEAMKVREEGQTRSAYDVRTNGRSGQVHFLTGGETRQMPVALASMASKYLRELMMECFNGWWCQRIVGLAPTAGYGADGRRFCRDVAEHLPRLGVAEEILRRMR